MTPTVNPKHAPKGYTAQPKKGGLPCEGCAFRIEPWCPNVRQVFCCTPDNRPDGSAVIYIKA